MGKLFSKMVKNQKLDFYEGLKFYVLNVVEIRYPKMSFFD